MNLADVMDDLGTALETITDLRVFPYWADRVTPPAAVVTWPDPLTFDQTMGRGSDRMTVPVIVMVGKVDARTTRDVAGAYADGSGSSSVKAAIEAFDDTATAYDTARVERAEFGVIPINGVELLSITFFVDVFGQGS